MSRIVIALIAAVLAVAGCAGGNPDAFPSGVPAATAPLTAEKVPLALRAPLVVSSSCFSRRRRHRVATFTPNTSDHADADEADNGRRWRVGLVIHRLPHRRG